MQRKMSVIFRRFHSEIFKTMSEGFCSSSESVCSDLHKVNGWKVPMFLKAPQASESLQTFQDISLPNFESLSSLAQIIKQCQSGTFQFPGFPQHLGANHLQRQDERSDSIFYQSPRFVTHIDDLAISALMDYYQEHLKDNEKVMDLCSSWISHLPNSLKLASLVGIGMNEKELKANKKLSKFYVQDLNKKADLSKFGDETFDSVLCAVSVDYLIKPFEVFSEVYRILKPGGNFIVSFSNRMFPSKAIKAWLMSNDASHLYIVSIYFQSSGPWEKVVISDISPGKSQKQQSDPMFVIHGVK